MKWGGGRDEATGFVLGNSLALWNGNTCPWRIFSFLFDTHVCYYSSWVEVLYVNTGSRQPQLCPPGRGLHLSIGKHGCRTQNACRCHGNRAVPKLGVSFLSYWSTHAYEHLPKWKDALCLALGTSDVTYRVGGGSGVVSFAEETGWAKQITSVKCAGNQWIRLQVREGYRAFVSSAKHFFNVVM